MTNEFKGLRHYIDIVEGKEQQVDEAGIRDALGQLGGAVAGTVANGANAVGNAVSGAYDAAKQGISGAVDAAGNAISGAVAPLVQGAKTGYANATGQPAPAPTQQAAAKPAAGGQSASPKAGGKSDPNVKALQDKLIAAGAKIKADGIMGPATRAAQAQFPNVTTQTPAEQAAASAPGAAPATAADQAQAAAPAVDPTQPANPLAGAPAATNATANTTGGPANLGTAGTQATAGGYAPAPAAAKAADGGPAPTPAQLKWLGGADPTDKFILARMRSAVPNAPAAAQATMEGVGFQNEELSRIISLIHHR